MWATIARWSVALVVAGLCLRGVAEIVGDARAQSRRAEHVARRRVEEAAAARANAARSRALNAEAARAQARWDSAGVDSYDYRLRVQCFCSPPPPLLVSVRGAEVVAVRDTLGRPLPEVAALGRALTVPQLFGELGSALADPARAVRAEFDPTYGYPARFSTESRIVSDVGYSLSVEAFRPAGQPRRAP